MWQCGTDQARALRGGSACNVASQDDLIGILPRPLESTQGSWHNCAGVVYHCLVAYPKQHKAACKVLASVTRVTPKVRVVCHEVGACWVLQVGLAVQG